DGLKTGNARAPELSLEIIDLMSAAWTVASLEFGQMRIRSGAVLTALLTDRTLGLRVRGGSPELAKVPSDKLLKEVPVLVTGSVEDTVEAGAPSTEPGPGGQTA